MILYDFDEYITFYLFKSSPFVSITYLYQSNDVNKILKKKL